jgi:hypothetical protein
MKKLIVLFMLFLVFPLISAEIIINQQPQEVYNLGDTIPFSITLKSTMDVSGIFQVDLLCSGQTVNFYKNGVSLSSGEEKTMDPSLILMKSVIGSSEGDCKVKAFLGDDFVLSDEFEVSDLIIMNISLEENEFVPEDSILIEGEALRENGKEVDGFVELSILEGNVSKISQLSTINNGFFSINVTLPKDMKAGAYLMKLKAHEEDIDGEKTNNGFLDKNIRVNQVPTSLEIVFENTKVEPGTNVIVKAILHDQTGEKIESTTFLTIKDSKNKILEQTDVATDEFIEFKVAYNEPPSFWKVVAVSNKLTSESTFEILEKEDVKIDIVNKTVTITNTGNVVYNKTVLIKIEDRSLNIDVYLEVDKSQKYLLTAPDGNYRVEVIADEKSELEESLALTGKTIDVKKAPGRVGSLVKYPFAWIFIILLLGFIAFIVFKRGYQKSFIGYIGSRVKKRKKEGGELHHHKESVSGNRAELSLSIKGDKQNVSVVALNIKNLKEARSKEGNMDETLQKIISLAEKHKAVTYQSHNITFFILAPIKTRTFKNEKTALNIAQEIKEILTYHNKMFKQRIDFGISLNCGTIVAKQEHDSFKFMSMGTLMTAAKKISSLAHNDILLGEKMNDQMRSDVKTTKHDRGHVRVFSIKEIKNVEEHRKFIKEFLGRMEKDKSKEKK